MFGRLVEPVFATEFASTGVKWSPVCALRIRFTLPATERLMAASKSRLVLNSPVTSTLLAEISTGSGKSLSQATLSTTAPHRRTSWPPVAKLDSNILKSSLIHSHPGDIV